MTLAFHGSHGGRSPWGPVVPAWPGPLRKRILHILLPGALSSQPGRGRPSEGPSGRNRPHSPNTVGGGASGKPQTDSQCPSVCQAACRAARRQLPRPVRRDVRQDFHLEQRSHQDLTRDEPDGVSSRGHRTQGSLLVRGTQQHSGIQKMKACMATDTFHTVHAEAFRQTHQCFTRWQGPCWVSLRDILEDANGKSSDNRHAATICGVRHVVNCPITHHLSRKQSHPPPHTFINYSYQVERPR